MIARTEEIRNVLLKLGYTKLNTAPNAFSEMYWYANGETEKLVIVCNAIKANIHSKLGVERLRKIANKMSGNISAENTLIVLVGSKETMRLSETNVITINFSTSLIKGHRITAAFREETESFKEYATVQSYKQEMVNTELYDYHNHSTWIVYGILAINIWAFMSTVLTGVSEWSVSVADAFMNKESYRLVTAMFTHGNLSHILSNSISLLVIGKALAVRVGTMDFLTVYMFGGVLGNVITLFERYDTNITAETVGASGAIFALLGALAVCVCNDRISTREKINFIIKKALLTLVFSSFGPNVDTFCHVGGFIAGAYVMLILALLDSAKKNNTYVKFSKKLRKRTIADTTSL